MCVTPAYRRSARPGGQHMTSTLENPASEAKCKTCSSVYSGKIAETNPSFIAVWLLSRGFMNRSVGHPEEGLFRGPPDDHPHHPSEQRRDQGEHELRLGRRDPVTSDHEEA